MTAPDLTGLREHIAAARGIEAEAIEAIAALPADAHEARAVLTARLVAVQLAADAGAEFACTMEATWP